MFKFKPKFERLPSMTDLSSHARGDSAATLVEASGQKKEVTPQVFELDQAEVRNERSILRQIITLIREWLWELIGIALCLCSAVVLISILLAYNRKPLPNIFGNFTLNAVISALASLAKAGLICILAATIGQQKWIWFNEQERPLLDLQTFVNAGIGPGGAFAFLIKRRGNAIAYISATTMLLAFGFEPFVQQLITYRQQSTLTSARPGSFTAIKTLSPGNDGKMLAPEAIAQAFMDQSEVVLTPDCATGNCSWPNYHSLAVCSQCTNGLMDVRQLSGGIAASDARELLGISESRCSSLTYAFNQGPSVSVPVCFVTADQGQDSTPSDFDFSIQYQRQKWWNLAFEQSYCGSNVECTANTSSLYSWDGRDHPLAAFGYLELDQAQTSGGIVLRNATRCSLSLCVKEYSRSLSAGKLVSQEVSSIWGDVTTTSNPNVYDWAATIDGITYKVSDYLTRLSYLTTSLRSAILLIGDGGINSTLTCVTDSDTNQTTCDDAVHNSTVMDALITNIGIHKVNSTAAFIDTMAAIAGTISDVMQRKGDSNATPVIGSVWQSQTYVEVHWKWLVYPFLLILAGLGTLVFTVIGTKHARLPAWKQSVMPLALRYLKNDETAEDTIAIGAQDDIQSLKANARKIRTRLIKDRLDNRELWLVKSADESEIQRKQAFSNFMARAGIETPKVAQVVSDPK